MVKALNHRQDRDKRIYCFRVERRGWLKRKSLTLSNLLHTNNYTKGFQSKVIHMSNNDSIDEETKRILSEADSNDSTESKKKKYPDKHITIKYDDDGFETNTTESPDSEW